MLGLLRARGALKLLRLSHPVGVSSTPIAPFNIPFQAISQRSIACTAAKWEPASKANIDKKATATAVKVSTRKPSATKKTSARVSPKPTKVAAKKKAPAKKTIAVKRARKGSAKAKGRPKLKPKPKPTKLVIPEEMKKPKGPRTPWIIFYSKFYKASDMDKNSLADSGRILAQASQVYQSLSELERQPFVDESALERKEYVKKHDLWNQRMRHNLPLLRKINKARKKKGQLRWHTTRLESEEATKRSGYNLFLVENYHKLAPTSPGGNVGAFKTIASHWSALTEEEKEGYRSQAKAS